MAALADQLTASGGAESVGFLNDLVAGLWPNIRVAGAQMIKDIAEPIFASTLPAPLNSLHFVKIDLGAVPITFHNVDVHKTANGGLKLDLDLDWDGELDVELDGKMIPMVGIEHVKLQGRLSVLLCPLTNVMPLINAAQVAFINQPNLQLKFTNAAAIADVAVIDKAIRNVILGIIASMAVLPNRFLVKLNAAEEIFNIYQHPLGILRLTVESGENFGAAKESKGFFKKILHDEADTYVQVKVASETFQTKTINNNRHPAFNETNDFIISDHDQNFEVDVKDDDTTSDDDLGIAIMSIKQLLLTDGGRHVLALTHNGQPTEGRLTVSGKFFNFVPDTASFNEQGPGVVGLLSVLIGSVRGLKGDRTQMKPSVKVTWGDKTFRTAIKTDAPGMDMENPAWDVVYNVPLKAGMIPGPPVRLTLMDAEVETAAVDINLDAVLQAPNLALQEAFVIGNAQIRAGVWIRGVQAAV